MNKDILIGRKRELKAIMGFMANKRNILVYGQEGVGKTSIIQKVISRTGTKKILYSQESQTLKEALVNLDCEDSEDAKKAERLNILALRKKCYGILAQRPDYIILDHVEKAGPRYVSFLEYLMEKDVSLIIVSCSLKAEEIGQLWTLFFAFEKLEIVNLDKTASSDLTDHFIKEFCIKVTKEEEFKQAIFHYSHGNPRVIRTLCLMARDAKYRRDNSLNVNLMDLDRRISEVIVK